ncbi:MAG: PTS transporter subunit EIIA [Rhodopirellula sp.]|nr:PTS transporter subunit EIIA [Rhodopirellula sp.]
MSDVLVKRPDCLDFRFPVKAEIAAAGRGLDKGRPIDEYDKLVGFLPLAYLRTAMPTEDFDIDRLATYLHLSPQQVMRLADRDKLPGRKVAGQWRFSQADIHHWLEQRIGLSDEEELIEMEGVLESAPGPKDPEDVVLADSLPVEAVAVPLKARTKNSVLSAMVDLAAGTGWLWDPEKMLEAIRAREEMAPTALEGGVALLHPRRPMTNILGQEFLALGITQNGIPFAASRGMLTDVFFLICSVSDRRHLRTLARLSRVIGFPGFLEALRAAPDALTAHELIAATEKKLG